MDTDTNRVAERPTGRGTTAEFGGELDPRGTEGGWRDDPEAAVVADGDRSERSYTSLDAIVETVAASAREPIASPQPRPERFVGTDRERWVFGPYWCTRGIERPIADADSS